MHHSPEPTDPTRAAAPPPQRRDLLQWLSLLLGGLGTAAVGIPVVGYLLGPLLRREPDREIDLGPLDAFPERQTRLATFDNPYAQPWDGDTRKGAAYVRRLQGDQVQVFAINCAHLGCPVSWFPESGLFLCPCHGGVYYEDGQHASGPPPRGLFQYAHRIDERGHLLITGGHLPTLGNPLAS